jgi:hypothetical protein
MILRIRRIIGPVREWLERVEDWVRYMTLKDFLWLLFYCVLIGWIISRV